MANQNHLPLFISRLIAPIAAKQGAHRRLNARNPNAATGVMTAARLPHTSAPSSATSANPNNIPKVATTFSFAIRPVTAATAIFQPSPACVHPRGVKIHAIALPILDRILESNCSASSIPKPPSVHPKVIRNQRTMVDSKMIVPAFLMKDQPRSHMLRRTAPTVGMWYAGSSITKGAGSPANILVFFSIIPEQMIAAIPISHAPHETRPELSKNAPAINAIIGSFAPQGINVVVIIVILRSLSFSIVREAMIPGTPQPVPIMIGIKDLPESPNLQKIRSMIKATLAI